ncbi:MAG: MFS transporter [Abitibacteriaceae bacterium]|nr:MFS transporter [Abditibacteriaceae bacterium]
MPSPPDSPHSTPQTAAQPDQNVTATAYELPAEERPASASPTEGDLEHELPGAEAPSSHDPYAAFRYRDYLLYALGSGIAAIGGQMQAVAISWEIYDRVKAAAGVRQAELALGLVGLVLAIPVILLVLPAGQMADRYSRKKIVLIGQACMALTSMALAALSYYQGPISWIYVILLLAGIAGTFSGPASSAILPQLIPAELLSNAITWNSTRWQMAATLGPALGGFLVATLHSYALIYVLDAICVAAYFGFMAAIHVQHQQSAREPVNFQTLVAGLRFVRDTKVILATITLDMFAVLLGGATMLLPVFAGEILHVGASGLGWLRAAPAIGALLMALALAHLPPMRRAGKTLQWAVIGFGLATIGFGLSRNFWLSMFMLALTGALDNISVVVRHTLVQVLTPDAMRGRVSAVNSVFIGTSNEIGGYESGQVAYWFGPVASVVGGGIGTIITVIAVMLIWPQVGQLGSLDQAAEE